MAYTASTTEPSKFTYVCRTQVGPTFGVVPPVSQTNEDDDDDEDQPAVVGYGAIIPRWAVSHPTPTMLLYFIDGPTFFSDAGFVAQAVLEATTEWNSLNFGVTFAATSTRTDANFNVTYGGPSPASDPTLWATAFFPNYDRDKRDLTIYSYALETGNRGATAKVLLHELGHVLGLRHEFAVSIGESPSAVEFGQTNAASVMSYSYPPTIQRSDVDAIREFYTKYKDGDRIDNFPVVDETPQACNTP